jgi:hypothetical protein
VLAVRKLALLFCLALTGCITVEKMPGPDGQEQYVLECDSGITRCYRRAATICPNGYTVTDKTDETAFVFRRFNMMIKCK